MEWERRYPFDDGHSYNRQEVIDEIERHIQMGTYENLDAARAWVKQLREKCTADPIVFSPRTERGFGRSPMNPNNWRTVNGDPIWEPENVSVKDLP